MNADEIIWHDDPDVFSDEECAGNRLDDVYDWVAELA